MEFIDFLSKAQGLPVIDTRVLSAGLMDSSVIKVQISRWEKSGKLIQLKRGIYLLAEPYRKIKSSGFYIAGVLKNPSYISLEKALEYHGLIPESVAVYTSVTTKRPTRFQTPAGIYDYRHVKPDLFWGYTSFVLNGQTAFMATPEKALLDFFYLRPGVVSLEYLDELRLQHVENINQKKLAEYALRFQKPGLVRTTDVVQRYINNHQKQVKEL
ncbi:MAG TPA: hypothetical protein DD723_09225 [Candidatus Omnitrophica bacterium]|nr:MAG: hypothetical protein A2Z81_08820 [Omnitrophica WOR_2 bacterium GWA2_45_18]OGX18977.1 MAG: hypothetical protein A2Y04_04670 [Omnitrophica WOR_2 bacterium GWC2_45_7]HBR15698.1 hypothetical protein [Candidatus Omnitrophota bacterium]